jgi:glycosyltransferase involved in cell wall biosynthesis
MTTTPTLSVVIPALNEENGIQQVAQRVLDVRPELQRSGFQDLELIVVDDGSTDRTAALASAMPGVRLIRHPRNRGYGAALKTGFAAATGEWVGFLDADGTYPPEYFPMLCRTGLARKADLVIGSRMAGAESEMPAVRRLGNWLFAGLVTLISGQRVTDAASGMRIFRRDVLERLYPLPDGLNLTPVMSTRALHENLVVEEEPIPYSERVGRSKLSVVRDGWRFAESIVWTALSYNPARLLGFVGLAAVAVAAVIGLVLVAARLAGIHTVGPVGAFALFLGLVLGVAGISVFSLGISFNYFVALFHRRPVRQSFAGRRFLPIHIADHFGWLGLAALTLGVVIGLGALGFALAGTPVERLWLYYLGSAGFVLIGITLVIAWVQMQVLQTLSEREQLVRNDLGSAAPAGAPAKMAGNIVMLSTPCRGAASASWNDTNVIGSGSSEQGH